MIASKATSDQYVLFESLFLFFVQQLMDELKRIFWGFIFEDEQKDGVFLQDNLWNADDSIARRLRELGTGNLREFLPEDSPKAGQQSQEASATTKEETRSEDGAVEDDEEVPPVKIENRVLLIPHLGDMMNRDGEERPNRKEDIRVFRLDVIMSLFLTEWVPLD
ncbi:unnamed protein product, partial [Amoebophrya sp. A25]|eukprot:GSA25T00003514001.1